MFKSFSFSLNSPKSISNFPQIFRLFSEFFWILLNRLVIFRKSWTSTVYFSNSTDSFSNSTDSFVTKCRFSSFIDRRPSTPGFPRTQIIFNPLHLLLSQLVDRHCCKGGQASIPRHSLSWTTQNPLKGSRFGETARIKFGPEFCLKRWWNTKLINHKIGGNFFLAASVGHRLCINFFLTTLHSHLDVTCSCYFLVQFKNERSLQLQL